MEQADTNQDFSSPKASLSLVQDWSRWGKNCSLFFACSFVQTKKIDPSVIYRKASPDQEVWWERAIWAISDPGKDFDAGKLHSSMWKLFHMEESASAASVFLFTRCEKENGRRDARSSSSFGTTLCDWAPAGKSKSSPSATLCKRSQRVLAHSAQYTVHSAIPHICHGRADGVRVNFFLAGVNFYRFNAKNWHFRQILRKKVAFFTDLTRKIGVFRCKFYSPKIWTV